MKVDKDFNDQLLDDLFKEVSLDQLPSEFTHKLMLKIEKEAVSIQRKNKWQTILQMIAGVVLILLIPVGVYYSYVLFVPEFNVEVNIPLINIDPTMLIIGCSVLFLLITDTLIRKFHHKKHAE